MPSLAACYLRMSSRLALLKLTHYDGPLTVLEFEDFDAVQVTERVHAIGHPLGKLWTYTAGIVSQIRPDYQWSIGDDVVYRADVIQVDAALNPGNSGGPIFSERGRVIGVSAFITEAAEGLNYAIAGNSVKAFLKSKENRYAPRPAKKVHVSQEDLASRPYDYDGDGKLDSMLYDIDGDGRGDAVGFDTNRDGNVEYMLLDTDGNGHIDTKVVRGTPGESAFVWYFDLDGDGKVNSVGYDVDGDWVVDRYGKP